MGDMENSEKPVIVTTADIPEDGVDSVKEVKRDIIDWKKKNQEDLYKDVEMSVDDEPQYKEVISEAKDNIVSIYKNAGIDIDSSNFPTVHLVPRDKIDHVSSDEDDGERDSGFYNSQLNNLYVFVEGGDSLLKDAENIHHELFHSIGRNIQVVNKEKMFTGQLGHRTQSKDKSRGQVLEEGTAMYYSRNFSIFSNSEVMQNIRQIYVKSQEEKYGKVVHDMLSDRDESVKDNIICSLGLDEDVPERYKEAYNLVQAISAYMPRKMEDVLPTMSMKNKLLSLRLNPNGKRDFMKKIDKIYGKGTTRDIYKLQFDDVDGIRNMVAKIQRINDSVVPAS